MKKLALKLKEGFIYLLPVFIVLGIGAMLVYASFIVTWTPENLDEMMESAFWATIISN